MTLEVFIIKILKKVDFSEICPKNLVGFLRTRLIFWTAIQDMLKMTVFLWVNIILGKVKSFETSRWFLSEMAGDFLAIGYNVAPRTF